jgi:D-alanine-D-alanine ligase-like ATP-grasp enzyme
MTQINEPQSKKSSCSYCGDAPVNHAFYFVDSVIAITLDVYTRKFIKHIPNVVKKFADMIPVFLFEILGFLKLVKFSSDINKANTFRSKIIWEEAQRRGIMMEQIIFCHKPLDHYRARLNGQKFYFASIPIKPEFLDTKKNWDDKVVLKEELFKKNIPIPNYFDLPLFKSTDKNIEKIFSKLSKPIIVKPRVGSRGRHTVTNINNLRQLYEGINIARKICSQLIIEEHLKGSVCRATLVNGVLAGFYRTDAPTVIGDGKKTIKELIEEKDNLRHKRIERINVSKELRDHIFRSGFVLDDVLPDKFALSLTHRMGRLFGGTTKEMLDELHPSFIPIFQEATKIVGLSVVGFDAIIPNPTQSADSQHWGIIECNSLPFIDLHYFALEGKPKNIAGMIWDMWN